MTLKIAQAPATLLPDGQKPDGPTTTPQSPGPAPADPPRPAYDDDWVRGIIRYACNLAAAEWGPEMAATEIEIQLLTPPLAAILNRHAPDVASGADQTASLGFVAVLVLVMGCRRGLIVRRKSREASSGVPAKAPERVAEKPPAAPEPPRKVASMESKPPVGVVMGGLLR